VEQKVSRATEIPVEGDDFVTQRVRDGYGHVMTFSALPYMRCPECCQSIQLPLLQIAEVRCEYCNARDSHDRKIWFTGYFPLCDKLLVELERTAPKRGTKWLKEMEANNRRVELASKRKFRNHAEAAAKDYWNQVAGNTVVGYGRGPASHGVL
jgi:hypothetical protein